MASLYSMTRDFENLFNQYEAITEMEFTPDGNGGYIDDDGNPVDPAAARQEMTEAWFDTLDGMEMEIQDKAENVAVYIKNIKAEADGIEAEKKRLDARLKAKRGTVERMNKYLLHCLESAKLKKIDAPRAVISVRNNAESVEVLDEKNFIAWAQENDYDELLRYAAPDVNKPEVKRHLQAQEEIPFVRLTRTQSVIIK